MQRRRAWFLDLAWPACHCTVLLLILFSLCPSFFLDSRRQCRDSSCSLAVHRMVVTLHRMPKAESYDGVFDRCSAR